MATQWFIVTDLGLSVVSGDDGVHAFVRSLTSTDPVAGAKVRLVAVNNEILGEATTDDMGQADFAPGLARGDGGMAPQLLVAETPDGDYAFLDMNKPEFDLVRSRRHRTPGARSARSVRDLRARRLPARRDGVPDRACCATTRPVAVTGLGLTLKLERPDGVLSRTEQIADMGAGSYFEALPLQANAMRGSWHARVLCRSQGRSRSPMSISSSRISNPNGSPSTSPRRTARPRPTRRCRSRSRPNIFMAPPRPISTSRPMRSCRPRTTLEGYPGYTFGREDDTIQTDQDPLGTVGTTDEAGNAVAEVTLPEPQATTRPLDAQIVMRLIDSNGRPVDPQPDPAGSGRHQPHRHQAGLFRLRTRRRQPRRASTSSPSPPTARLPPRPASTWTLSRITTTYQWYRDNGTWKWEAITSTTKVANGTVDTTSDGPVRVGAPVDWGQLPVRDQLGRRQPDLVELLRSMPATTIPKPVRTRPTRSRSRSTSRPTRSATPPF